MELDKLFAAHFSEHQETARRTAGALLPELSSLLESCTRCIENGGKILIFGNGGSASDAQHIATELTIRYSRNRLAIAALALNTDTSALTACGNDLGFDRIFARQIEALGRRGDVALAISTSGRSPNILAALAQARSQGLVTAALSGRGGGELGPLADHILVVPSDTTARIQEMHITLGHILCAALEQKLGLMQTS